MLHAVGRPSSYTAELAAILCQRLANGQNLIAICEDPMMPVPSTVYRWQEEHEEFRGAYARARQALADYAACEVLHLSDVSRIGTKTEEGVNAQGAFSKTITADMVDRAKLQVDARKWFAARVAPDRYGDRLAHQMLDEKGKPAKLEITVSRVPRTEG